MDINPKSLWHVQHFAKRYGGFHVPGKDNHRFVGRLDPWDTTRRDMLILLLRTILQHDTPGALAELGVYKGATARLIHDYLPERDLYLFDTFAGFTNRGAAAEKTTTGHDVSASSFADTSVEVIRTVISRRPETVHIIQGYFPDSIPDHVRQQVYAFVHLDADLFEPTFAGLTFFYPRMAKHGLILAHDYNAWPGVRQAVDEFMADKPERVIPMPDKSGSALIVREGP